VTIVDSSWKISFVLYSKYFPDQPNDVQVLWADGQCSERVGDFIKKPMVPLYETIYDLGVLASSIKETLAIEAFNSEYLHEIALSSPAIPILLKFLNTLPKPVL
jgi:myosin-crossreactive antigen